MPAKTKYIELPEGENPSEMLASQKAKGWRRATTIPIPVIVNGKHLSRYWLIHIASA